MGKYLTEFSSNTAYNAALATLDFPNVSLVANELKYAESLPAQYRWVNDGNNTICGDGDLEDSCTLFQRTKKQKSVDGGQTWSDVVPAEYGYGDIIEEDSGECGCGDPFGCRDIDLADENGESYYGELVQGIQFGHIAVMGEEEVTVYIWDKYETGYIGKVVEQVEEGSENDATVYIYDDNDTLIDTIEHYREWTDNWIRLCKYFSHRCMKLSTSSSDEDAYPYDGFPIIIKANDEEDICDCHCFE